MDTAAEASARFGRRALIAGATGGAVLAATARGATASAATPAYSAFEVVDPTRLVDTRPTNGDFGYTRLSDRVIRIQVTGRALNGGATVPSDASAAVFTLVGINQTAGANWLSSFPSGSSWPGTASLNMSGWANVSPNLVTVKLGPGGAVDVLADLPAWIILDLVGVYRPTGGSPVRAGRFRLLPVSRRVVDSRSGAKPGAGATLRVDLTTLESQGLIDPDAIAVSANITAVGASDRGFLTAYPFGTSNPGTSTLNVEAGQTRGVGSMAKLGRDSSGRLGFNVYVDRGAHVVVDVVGFMTGPGANSSTTGQFVAIQPARLLDTRRGDGGQKRLWPGWTRAFQLPASYASQTNAIVMNLAVARTMGGGYFTVLAAQTQRANVSTLNVTAPGQVMANHTITAVSTKGVECYSSAGGDLICDVVGWFKATSPVSATLAKPIDPPPPAIDPPYWMDIPRLGLGRSVTNGSSVAVVDSGKIWHWTGTGRVGDGRAIATFGHRTEAGGPLRNVHLMGPGDQVALFTEDARKYTYEYDSRVLTSKQPTQILAATRQIGGEMLSIIACTVGFDSSKPAYPDRWAPTSLEYRIIVRLRLVRWEDII